MSDDQVITCPFCGYKTDAEYAILLHIETQHAEGQSPFVATEDCSREDDANTSAEEDQYAECPIDGCGETVTLAELDEHVELHAAEEPDATGPSSYQNGHITPSKVNGYRSPYTHHGNVVHDSRSSQADDQAGPREYRHSSAEQWKKIMPSLMKMPKKAPEVSTQPDGASPPRKRLGKDELGKYAHEKKMPDWLVSLLKKGIYESADGIISVLEQLLQQNPNTQYAYLCHPTVHHISKLKREGGFCGYRNIQMLSSYIIGASAPGVEQFRGKIPSIFRIQDYIENAWDMGINAVGRIETGGVKGTRKYIGTPEAQAMFLSLGIRCDPQGFKNRAPGMAEANLLAAVERYFQAGRHIPQAKVRMTGMPPIYFQHKGHSLTIVGLEKRSDDSVDLLVFDPMFHDPEAITRHIGRRFEHKNPNSALNFYRRGHRYLKKYSEFELLKLRG